MRTVIIGGVAAGMSAASKLKRLNPNCEVVVFERGKETSYGACGLPYYISGVNKDENLLRIRTADAFIASGIDLRLCHEVLAVDSAHKSVQVKNLTTGEESFCSYDQLVIATGADSILPPWPGSTLNNIFTLKSIEDANCIRAAAQQAQRIAVIGGGYIGLEMVEAFHKMGKEVLLFEKDSHVLTSFDVEFSELVEAGLAPYVAALHTNESVVGFEGKDTVQRIVTNKGIYEVDLVLVAVGVRPNTGFLQGCNLATLDNGALLIDEMMRTSIPNIWAAGDCASVRHKLLQKDVYIPLATNANKQGRYLAENIAGQHHAYLTALGTAMIKIGEMELGRTGLSEKEAIVNNVAYLTTIIQNTDHAPYYPGGEDITIKLVFSAESGVVLGAQLFGRQGVALRTDVMAACISAGMTVKQVGELDFGYAPPYAMPWDALHVAANVSESLFVKNSKKRSGSLDI